MHKFHYKYIEAIYDNCAKLLFTDTDSLVYDIETDDVYEDFYENKTLFDFSDYLEDSNFFYPVNKNVVEGKTISEFVGLKSKIYSLIIGNNEEIKKKVSIKMFLKT